MLLSLRLLSLLLQLLLLLAQGMRSLRLPLRLRLVGFRVREHSRRWRAIPRRR